MHSTFKILKIIFNAKQKMANNHIHEMRRHLWIHILMGFGVLIFLVGGGTGFFFALFDFLNADNLQPFGSKLLEYLLGMIFLAFFSMLVFSNIIITLSTTYISRDMDFYMSLPINYRSIFLVKLTESIIYSSWAFVILSFPIFMAYGAAIKAPWHYYPLTALLVFPYLVVPAGVGAILTMLISAYLPARKTRLLSVALAVGSIIITIVAVRMMGFRRIFALSDIKDFGEIMGFLSVGNDPVFPNYWFTQGLKSAAEGNLKEWFYWLMVLTSTGLMFVQVCWWLVPPLYYRGWCLSRESSSTGDVNRGFSILNLIDKGLRFLPARTRALVSKDIKTFWRDPAQWTQIFMLFGLLFIYIANLRYASKHSGTVEIFLPKWQTLLSFFNLGATCFILSIITTRFIYPLLSLEGKQFWVVGLAPMKRNHIVWEKYWLCAIGALILTESMMLFSNYILKVDYFMRVISAVTIFIMTFGLTSLSVGLGAISPDFREDNPARIANGFGGTLNVVLSLVYTGIVIAFEIYPVYMDSIGRRALTEWPLKITVPYMLGFVLVNAATIVLPMKIGLKKWKEMEM